jgi:hypothetical protein
MGVIVALSSAHSCPLASSGTILAAFVAMQTTTGPSTAPNDSHANRSAPLGMTSMCGGGGESLRKALAGVAAVP